MSEGGQVIGVAERMKLIGRAFLPASPVHTQELLAGRKDQLFSLLEITQTIGQHAAIFGERGVGKTSVAAVMANDLASQGSRVVRLNCSTASTYQSLWRDVATEILSNEPSDFEVGALTGLVSGPMTQQDIVRAFRGIAKSLNVVVILDEFDILADDSIGEDFANLMKAMADDGQDIHIVVVGVAEDVDSILAGHRSVGRNLSQVRMPRLGEAEIKTILANGFSTIGLTAPKELGDRVVQLCQGLPHYAHLLARELAKSAVRRESLSVSIDDWPAALSGALDHAEQQIVDLYSDATTTAKPSMFRSLLLACALAPKDDQGFFRPVDVQKPLQRISGKRYALASYTGNLASLATDDRGPAFQAREWADRRKRYRFANPLLEPYVIGRAVSEGIIGLADASNPTYWQ